MILAILTVICVAAGLFETYSALECYVCTDNGSGPCFNTTNPTAERCDGAYCYRARGVKASRINIERGCANKSGICDQIARADKQIKYCTECHEALCNFSRKHRSITTTTYLILVIFIVYLGKDYTNS